MYRRTNCSKSCLESLKNAFFTEQVPQHRYKEFMESELLNYLECQSKKGKSRIYILKNYRSDLQKYIPDDLLKKHLE
jgi:hypothetical protein